MAKKRNDISVKIDPEVYRLVKMLAAWQGVTVAECLSELVRQPAEREFAKVHRETGKRIQPDNP